MVQRTPVSIQSNAFLFCRIGITVILWLAFFLQAAWALWLAFAILALSALLGVDRAPMIVLYNVTLGKLMKSKQEMLDRSAMRFAHTMGTVFSAICLLLLYTLGPVIAWRAVFLLAILKTISALGWCPASKLYTCATGGCCPLSRKFFGTPKND